MFHVEHRSLTSRRVFHVEHYIACTIVSRGSFESLALMSQPEIIGPALTQAGAEFHHRFGVAATVFNQIRGSAGSSSVGLRHSRSGFRNSGQQDAVPGERNRERM